MCQTSSAKEPLNLYSFSYVVKFENGEEYDTELNIFATSKLDAINKLLQRYAYTKDNVIFISQLVELPQSPA